MQFLAKKDFIQMRRREGRYRYCGSLGARGGRNGWRWVLLCGATWRDVIVLRAVTAGRLSGVVMLQAYRRCWQKKNHQAEERCESAKRLFHLAASWTI